MRSFSVLATIACAALSYAAPLISVEAGAKVDAIAKVGAAVQARHDQGIPDVIQQVTVQITTVIAPLTFLTSQNATVDVVTPILSEVKTILGGAVTEVTTIAGTATGATGGLVGGLVGGLLKTVFSLAGQVLSLADVAGLLATLLKVVFTALGVVLKVVSSADKAALQPILAEVAGLVADLLKVVLPLLGGLVGALIPLIGDVLTVVDALGVTDLFAALGLKL
ncbi:hypothetical protein L218DRAFT_946334 [Marasmius fiardii PR-910]|nr:hypothetical protein L218DRAFT_946334 [Marasmius fiardii PR-910]